MKQPLAMDPAPFPSDARAARPLPVGRVPR